MAACGGDFLPKNFPGGALGLASRRGLGHPVDPKAACPVTGGPHPKDDQMIPPRPSDNDTRPGGGPDARPADVAIRFDQVSKSFPGPGGTPVSALEDIDLTVNSGAICGIIGRSGAGKSTLLRIDRKSVV